MPYKESKNLSIPASTHQKLVRLNELLFHGRSTIPKVVDYLADEEIKNQAARQRVQAAEKKGKP